MRARSFWRRIGLALAILSLALYAVVVAPHVHANADTARDCPIWTAHGSADAAVAAPGIACSAPKFAAIASDFAPAENFFVARVQRNHTARAPPVSIA
jgi:hypothetical protein